jgi:transcriptional regulator with XRE-family HTH domain
MYNVSMFDISSYCEGREKDLQAAGIHIADILKRAGVDRSSWTGWKHRGISPRLDTLRRVDEEIAKELARADRRAKRRKTA